MLAQGPTIAPTTVGTTLVANPDPTTHRVATWGVSPQSQQAIPGLAPAPTPPTFTDTTFRQIVHTSLGGTSARVRLSNALGTTSLVVNAATIGLRGQVAQLVPGSIKTLTFGGRSAVTIPPGGLAISDPVKIQIPELGDVAISTYFQAATNGTTLYSESKETNYVLTGNQTQRSTQRWPPRSCPTTS